MDNQQEFFEYTFSFTKEWSSRLISHLDLMRLLVRALRRTGLKLYFSQGFNPKPKLSYLTPPLPLGATSACELAAFRTSSPQDIDGLKKLLTDCFPPGIAPVEVREAVKNDRNIIEIEYILYLDSTPDIELIRTAAGEWCVPDSLREISISEASDLFGSPDCSPAEFFSNAVTFALKNDSSTGSPVKNITNALKENSCTSHVHRAKIVHSFNR